MADVYSKLKELGIELTETPKPLGSYIPSLITSRLIFVSGQLPIKNGDMLYTGKLGLDLSLEDGILSARQAAINSISVLENSLHSLNSISRIVKLTGYVASGEGFNQQADVINGASNLFYEIFGEKGRHARAAVGVYELPMNAPVEIEVIAELEN